MLDEHLGYVSDPVRLENFNAAIAKAVKPGDRVADLGCGSGILGLLCLQGGAAHVDAIDATSMIDVARESLVRAGWGERVAFISGHSHRIDLPERVDVVICDHVGFFGFDYGIVGTLQDARRRFLKPGGRLIPARFELQLAAVESATCHALAEGWRTECVLPEFHWLRQQGVNTKHPVDLKREELLSPPATLGSIDLHGENPDYFSWTAELHVERDGVVHGLGGWFQCELAEEVWMTNSPLAERPIRRSQAFLPLGEAIEVKSGDVVQARVMARPADQLIAWEVDVPARGTKQVHSTWQSELLTPEEFVKRTPGHVPHPGREGRARMIVLGYCDGRRTVREIEQVVLRDHPDMFPSADAISHFVARVLGQDTR
jgi:protein arginine N-methyltransferase 1